MSDEHAESWRTGHPDVPEGSSSELVDVKFKDGTLGYGTFHNGWDRSRWLTGLNEGSEYDKRLLGRGWTDEGKRVEYWKPRTEKNDE